MILKEWLEVLFNGKITPQPFLRAYISLSCGYPYGAGTKFQIMYVALFLLLISCAIYIIRHIYFNGLKGLLKSLLVSIPILALYSLIMEYVWIMGW